MTNISNNNLQHLQTDSFNLKGKLQPKEVKPLEESGPCYAHYNGDEAVHQAFQEGKLREGDTYTDGGGRTRTVGTVVYNGRNKDGVMLGGWGSH